MINPTKPKARCLLSLGLLVLALVGFTACVRKTGEKPEGVVARVQTIPLKKKMMEEKIKAYGKVLPIPGRARIFAVPYETLIRRIFVIEGQEVSAGQPLIEVASSPDARLKLDQARSENEAAKTAMTYVKERLRLKMATRQDLLAATRRLELAGHRLNSLLRRGIDGPEILKASTAGTIWKVRVQPGEILPAGRMMLAMVKSGRVSVMLGVEPADINRVRVGQTVVLKQVNWTHSPDLAGRVMKIAHQINPRTRLINVLVQPAERSGNLLLNDYVSGLIVIAGKRVFVVPRAALLPNGRGNYTLFTVSDHKAHLHTVRVGMEGRNEVQVMANGLREGMRVVISGNYELADNMSVSEKGKR